jgi:hypothetical protein
MRASWTVRSGYKRQGTKTERGGTSRRSVSHFLFDAQCRIIIMPPGLPIGWNAGP